LRIKRGEVALASHACISLPYYTIIPVAGRL
jgi:hypothetical protein